MKLHQYLTRLKQKRFKPLKKKNQQRLSKKYRSICPSHLCTTAKELGTSVKPSTVLLRYFAFLPTTPSLPSLFPSNSWIGLHNQQDNAAGIFFSILQTHRHYQSPTWRRDKVLHPPMRREREQRQKEALQPESHLTQEVMFLPSLAFKAMHTEKKQPQCDKMRSLRTMNSTYYFLKTSTFLSLCKFIIQQSRLSLNENQTAAFQYAPGKTSEHAQRAPDNIICTCTTL